MMSVNEAEAKVKETTAVVEQRKQDLVVVHAEAEEVRKDLSRLDEQDAVTDADILKEANLRRKLRQLEQQAAEHEASVSGALADLVEAQKNSARARKAELCSRLEASHSEIIALARKADAEFNKRLAEHGQLLTEASIATGSFFPQYQVPPRLGDNALQRVGEALKLTLAWEREAHNRETRDAQQVVENERRAAARARHEAQLLEANQHRVRSLVTREN